MRWEIIVNSSDTAGYAFDCLYACLRRFDWEAEQQSFDKLRLEVSTYCWTIIDHTYACMQMLRRLDLNKHDAISALLNKYGQSISKLRNSMDHIGTNISNLASKNSGLPAYGFVQFLMRSQEDGELDFFGFGLGVFHDEQAMSLQASIALLSSNEELGNIVFTAFNDSVNVSNLSRDMKIALAHYDNAVRSHVTPLIEEFAKEENLELQQVMEKSYSGTGILRLRLKIQDNDS